MRLFLGGVVLCAAAAAGGAVEPLPATVLPATLAAPRIDGQLDDPAWQRAPRFDAFRRFRPDVQSSPGPYRTEVRVLVTPGALVFGIRAWDPNPAELRAPLSRRDQVGPDQDSVVVWIDPSGRSDVAQFVRVNAAGSVSDGLYSAAQDQDDLAPDFLDVEVAAQRLSDGYSVELRWPLAMLRYPLHSTLPWGLMVTRSVPRSTPLSFSSAPLEREQAHLLTQMQRLSDDTALRAQLQGAGHVQIKPELTLRHSGTGVRATLGAELQWRPRADGVIDSVLRPDFSQVELDDPQLAGNTRYALFLPEKRAFFLESSDVVGQVQPDDWGISRGLLAFYSRAVADPQIGLRATYRGSTQEATALMVRDAGGGVRLHPDAFGTHTEEADRASTLLFARHRFQLTPGLSLAPLVSLRDWAGGERSGVAGFDGQWNTSQTLQWRGHWLGSQAQGTPDHAAWVRARWRTGDWRVIADWERIGPRFVNDNGFVPQNGIERRSLDLVHAFHPPEGNRLTALEALLRVIDTQALRDPARGVPQRQVVSHLLQPGVYAQGPLASELWAFWNHEQQRTRAGGVLHRPRSLLLGFSAHPSAQWVLLGAEATLGERIDSLADRVGRGHNVSGQLGWRQPLAQGRNIEFEQRVARGLVRGPGGAEALVEASAQTKLLLHWRRDQALRLVWQTQRVQRAAEPGIAPARWRNRTGTLTWLAREGGLRGWSLGASWSRDDGALAQRELFVKYQQRWGQ